MTLFGAILVGLTYWQVIRADELVYGPYNPRLAEESSRVTRGRILDRTGGVLAESQPGPSGMQRRYTEPSAAQVIGYYSQKHGESGLESAFTRYLRGDVQAGAADTLVDQMLHRPRNGADLLLTLDPKVQTAAARALGANKGAAVALDPHTGAVLAMGSVPYYDPNRLEEQWSDLQNDPNRPLYNRAAQGLYTPGSVFKIVTATAAIDLGLVDLDKKYTCTDDLVVDGFRIQNKNHPGISTVTFVDDFAYSCNVTFAKTGLGLDTKPLPVGDDLPNPPPWIRSIDESRRRFVDYAHRFGLEASIPFDLPTSTSKIGMQPLSRVELANTAFGQGELQVSPLLMALATATIANSGVMPEPYLVQEIRDHDGRVLQRHTPRTIRQVMSADTARAMNRLMVTSVREGYAKPAQIDGIDVGGKTGSAEVGPGQATHSWFIGYAPADNPKVAVAVIMENRGPGSDFATPAGRIILQAAVGR